MPNGGSDCCGTCWFNKSNGGRRAWQEHGDKQIPPHCEIRGIDLEDPFYTYCANHPHRRPFRDRIPIGPLMTGDSNGDRELWLEIADTPEIRQHHIDILHDVADGYAKRDSYPLGLSLLSVVVWQLEQWKERRAIPILEALIAEDSELEEFLRSTIERVLTET